MNDKRQIAESLHEHTNRVRLAACEVGVLSREISTLENMTTPLFEESLSSPMGVLSRDIMVPVLQEA